MVLFKSRRLVWRRRNPMPSYSHKRILILLPAGLVVSHGGRSAPLKTDAEVASWLSAVPEFSLIASMHHEAVPDRDSFSSDGAHWQHIANRIKHHYDSVDGIVLAHPSGTLDYTAAALSFFLRDLGKPVILVAVDLGARRGRPAKMAPGTDLALRASLVNALQFATMDIGEVAVLAGNKLFRGVTYSSQQPHDAVAVGRVDFGLRLEATRKKRTAKKLTVRATLQEHVLSLQFAPGVFAAPKQEKIEGIFLSLPEGALADSTKEQLRRWQTWAKVICAYHQEPVPVPASIVHCEDMLAPVALVKFMWALGQTNQIRSLQKLLDTDYAGEFLHPHGRKP